MLDRSSEQGQRTDTGLPSRRPRPFRPRPGARFGKLAHRAHVDLGRVRVVIDALPEAVFVTEPDGELRLTNPAADRLFAMEPIRDRADLLSRFEEVSRLDEAATATGARPAAARPVIGRSVTVRPRNQPNRWYALRSVALDALGALDEAGRGTDGAPPSNGAGGSTAGAAEFLPDDAAPSFTTGNGADAGRTVFVLRDVTDSRDLEPVREAFLDILSHELRTPITTIYAGSSVLARHRGLSPSATRTLASDISSEAARLFDLVEDLLVLARLERRILDPIDEPILLQRSVDATIRLIGDRVTGARIERTGDPDPPPIRGDATYVEQACRDLMLAGIRFAGEEPGRELVVELRSDPAAREVQLAVLDRGPGLTPAQIERAFELPDSSDPGRLGGAGVGPFVCRHLVVSMGGRVWARNRRGGGVEMGFALRADDRT
ncbi:MAG: HAMP domain-containing histidine kinase [Chloroflexi bacterium]|nr:HAMP domain-containing histidine kinase [Chloroflexota bacterium]